MAVNRAGADLPRDPEHWAIADGQWARFFVPLRGCAFHVENGETRAKPAYRGRVHSRRRGPYITDVWDESASGTSSLFGVFVAHRLGYRAIVLAGCPMDGSGHYYDAPGASYHRLDSMWEAWERAAAAGDLVGVTSLSGRTRELLGAPC